MKKLLKTDFVTGDMISCKHPTGQQSYEHTLTKISDGIYSISNGTFNGRSKGTISELFRTEDKRWTFYWIGNINGTFCQIRVPLFKYKHKKRVKGDIYV